MDKSLLMQNVPFNLFLKLWDLHNFRDTFKLLKYRREGMTQRKLNTGWLFNSNKLPLVRTE